MHQKHWKAAVLVALVLPLLLAWWQHGRLGELQARLGSQVAEDYRLLGLDVRQVRVACGRLLISTGPDRERVRVNLHINLASLNRKSAYPGYNNFLEIYDFLYNVRRSLEWIREEGDTGDESVRYLCLVHGKLAKMEELFYKRAGILQGPAHMVARRFYRGEEWPAVLAAMAAVIDGNLVSCCYEPYRPSPGDYPPGVLEGPRVSEAEALQRAQEFLGLPPGEYTWVVSGGGWSSTRGSNWWFTALPEGGDGFAWEVEVLETGGHVLSGYRRPARAKPYNPSHSAAVPPEPDISASQALTFARGFMHERGQGRYVPFFAPNYGLSSLSDTGEGSYLVELLRQEGEIYFPEDRLQVEICGATGSVVSWRLPLPYPVHHPAVPGPILSRDEARAAVNSRYIPQGGWLLDSGSGLLCYLFTVAEEGIFYEVRINAVTGEEVSVDYLWHPVMAD